MYVASKYALGVVPPFTLLFMRFFLAAIILLIWCRRTGIEVVPKTDKWLLFQVGFVGYFLSISAQFIGTKLSTAHMGAVITTLSPVFQSGFAVLLLGERVTLRQVGSILIALAGVLIITGLPGINGNQTLNLGSACFLLAALFWGYYSVLAKKAAPAHSALQVTTWGILVATTVAIIPALLEIGSWKVNELQNPLVLFSIGYLAFFATAVAFFCWNKGLSMMSPHQAGLFFFLQPIVGSMLGYLLLDEMLSSSFAIGSMLVVAGVYSTHLCVESMAMRSNNEG
jgi:drug/metabolite transporter (DMT)-like permease